MSKFFQVPKCLRRHFAIKWLNNNGYTTTIMAKLHAELLGNVTAKLPNQITVSNSGMSSDYRTKPSSGHLTWALRLVLALHLPPPYPIENFASRSNWLLSFQKMSLFYVDCESTTIKGMNLLLVDNRQHFTGTATANAWVTAATMQKDIINNIYAILLK